MENKSTTCGESCGCHAQNKKSEEAKNNERSNQNIETATIEEQDPTKFGDWQINGRTIDF